MKVIFTWGWMMPGPARPGGADDASQLLVLVLTTKGTGGSPSFTSAARKENPAG